MDPRIDDPVTEDRVLVITRSFDAPRALVWRAFADSYHLRQWWGPKGYTNPVCELDFRVGGHWHNVMRGPDGTELPTDVEFIEIVEPERIVYRNAPAVGDVWGDSPPPSFLRTITFEENNGRTTLTIRAEFETADHKRAVVRRGFVQGTNESLDKLTELLMRQRE